MHLLAKNLLLGLVFLCVPLAAEAVAALHAEAPGSGINLLLYSPFRFALIGLAVFAFLALNVQESRRRATGTLLGLLAGLVASAAWIGTAVLVVLQAHLWRGGQM
tara:strand:+ start:11455 stop:11769 length:315 start_codon:yes stop_codon:yes gene_type:complete